MGKLVRVNARISQSISDWLEERSEETGISKSALISLSLEQSRERERNSDQLDILKQILDQVQLESDKKNL